MNVDIIHGDVREEIANLPELHFHGLLTDPPYGLNPSGIAKTWDDLEKKESGFLGMEWDAACPGKTFWQSVYPKMKPGGILLVFGGTRVWHRLACAIEDAGFLVRDTLMWVYGSGMPKSTNISIQIDKKMGEIREKVKRIRIDGKSTGKVRTGYGQKTPGSAELMYGDPISDKSKIWDGYGTGLKPAWEPIILAMKPVEKTFADNVLKYGSGALAIENSRIPESQRWPSNFLLDEESKEIMDLQTGMSKPYGKRSEESRNKEVQETLWGPNNHKSKEYPNEEGYPSRFFYCSKCSPSERKEGLENKNIHPTLKPIDLTTYLAGLILPAEGERNLFVPFCGSGSEIIGGIRSGWDNIIGIEQNEEYIQIANQRIMHWQQKTGRE